MWGNVQSIVGPMQCFYTVTSGRPEMLSLSYNRLLYVYIRDTGGISFTRLSTDCDKKQLCNKMAIYNTVLFSWTNFELQLNGWNFVNDIFKCI